MQITVQIRPDVASDWRRREHSTWEVEELNRLSKELGVVLEPMHPGTTDVDLSGYFTIEVPDCAIAEKVIQYLRQNKAILAAYVKPPDALP
jgi:hypothetical protein